MTKTSKTIATLLGAAALVTLAGCTSDADRVAENLSKAAEQFEVQREITVLHPITGEITFRVEGRCSMESAESALSGYTEVTCMIGPDEYTKDYIAPGDNGQVLMHQLDSIDVSRYHHRVIVKPESILPEIDFETGEQ